MDVVLRPRAEDDLDALYEYILNKSGDFEAAFSYIWRLRGACISLSEFSQRGVPRDDILKGLRILVFERSTVIAYRLSKVVEILSIFHGGQDWYAALRLEQ